MTVYFIQRKTSKENNLIDSLNNQELFAVLQTQTGTETPRGHNQENKQPHQLIR